MSTFKYIELSSCVRGERFKYTFKGDGKQYVALLTESQYKKYKEDFDNVNRTLLCSPVVFTSNTDEDKLFIVRDLDDKDLPEAWSGTVKRYSPLIPVAKIDNLPSLLNRRVRNATDTDADESMIQYWEDNKDKDATIDLSKKTLLCSSCGKEVKTDELDGAHVVFANGGSKTLYITPTCRTCNRSKVNRIFEVNKHDLVIAPEEE